MRFCDKFSNFRVIFICNALICVNIKITWLNSVTIIPKQFEIVPENKQMNKYRKTVRSVLSTSDHAWYFWIHYAIWNQVDVEKERAFGKKT